MARRKVTCALQLENWQQADDALRQIGENRRDLAAIENMLNERIADAKADAEAKGRPIKDHIAMLEQALREFATLHRADLGKAKSRTLTFGKVGFRQSTRLTLPRGVEKVKTIIEELLRRGMKECVVYPEPKIDKDAFLVAEATGWERLNLLQGEANVYFENTFVGKSILDPGQTSDTLRFSMGRDRSIRIERTKENDYSSRRAIGSNQTQTVAWKFSVRNTRPEPVVLTLADQLPVSRNSAIAVSAEELSGGQLDKESGIVTWRLELKPGEQRELRLRYAVKYPKGRSLTIE
mgnify:FL=1